MHITHLFYPTHRKPHNTQTGKEKTRSNVDCSQTRTLTGREVTTDQNKT